MSNYVNSEIVARVRELEAAGASTRTIARELGIAGATVQRYLSKNDAALQADADRWNEHNPERKPRGAPVRRPVDDAHDRRRAARFAAGAPDFSAGYFNSSNIAAAELRRRIELQRGCIACVKCGAVWQRAQRGTYECRSCGHRIRVDDYICVQQRKLPLYVYLRLEHVAQAGVLTIQESADVCGVNYRTAFDVIHKIRANGGKLL